MSASGGKDIDGRLPTAWRNSMTKSALIAVAAALLLGGTSLASAKNRGAAGAHSKPSRPSINEITPSPSINQITPRASVADPYYRLSDSYYGYADPYPYSTSMPCRLTAQVTPTATSDRPAGHKPAPTAKNIVG